MDHFQQKFKEDAIDLISSLEQTLLDLDANRNAKDLIEQVFRVMHTLKGVSSMYGYERIGEYTHHLETIYDFIRDGKATVSDEVLNLTLSSVDHIRELLEDPQMKNNSCKKVHEELMSRVIAIVSKINGTEGSQNQEEITQEDTNQLESKEGTKTYYIQFVPVSDLLIRGVNPLAIFEELSELGECFAKAYISKIPKFQELDATQCYISWEIFIVSEEEIESVEDVFIFVDEEAKIFHISNNNILENDEFKEELNKREEFYNVDELKEFVKQFEEQAKSQTEEKKEEPIQIKEEIQPQQAATPSVFQEKTSKVIITDQVTSSIRVASDKLDELMNLVSELVTTQAELSLIAEQNKIPRLTSVAESVEKLSRQLRDNAFSICLIPIESMLVRFKRLVRDLSNELGKNIKFVTEGTETELDKTIIDNLANPLMHIIRNSMDHGIESTEERIASGKPEQGILLFKAFYSGASVHIQIKDDGKGIDTQKIRQKAISKGLIVPEAILSDKEILDLIFIPGFSTAEKVTEVSGRGVGMDVVRKRISSVRGEVEIDSEVGKGTTITIKLPLTLSIVDALLVKIDTTNYLIPLSSVDHCSETKHIDLENITNNRIVLGDKLIPYIYLRKEFDIETKPPKLERLVIVNYEGQKVAIIVDFIVGEHQAVLKSLGEIYKNQSIISGASILGDGSVALVIDTNKLISQYAKEMKIGLDKRQKDENE